MPPRKKQRTSPAAEALTPTASTPNDITNRTAEDAAPKLTELEPELWTDDEEISLFKGMIRWKPVGMHKRFRMISISQHMRHQGHISEHTRPTGIREKLDGLYNVKVLDDRENGTEDLDSDAATERYCEFILPKYEFHDLMMEKRVDPDRESSPEWLEGGAEDEEIGSTVEDSDAALSSAASSVRATRGPKRGRGSRGGRGTGGRGRGAADSTTKGRPKAESEASEESDDDEGEEEAEEEDEEDDDEEDEDEDAAEEDAPATRGGRGRGRGRGNRGPRTRGRGRKRG